MKEKRIVHLLRKLTVPVLVVCALIVGAKLWNSSASQKLAASNDARYMARLRDGLSDLQFASPNSSMHQIRASVDSLSSFIYRRSGHRLDQSVKDKLAAMEERVLNGSARKTSAGELGTILTESICARVGTLTDQEIEQAVEIMRGFDAPDLPESWKGGRTHIRIRGGWDGPKVNEELFTQIREFRDQARAGNATFKLLVGSFVRKEVENCAELLNGAAPDQFVQKSGTWNSPASVEFTPAQALLVVYSVISDDFLWYSEANHRKYLIAVRDFSAKTTGYYPSPDGYFAYGPNGYMHSSPLGLFMNGQTLDHLLRLTEERSAR